MATKNIKDFDKTVGRKLAGYTEQPPADLFARIERTLAGEGTHPVPAPVPVPATKKIIRHIYRYAAAAAILTGVVFATDLIRDTRPVQLTAVHDDTSVSPVGEAVEAVETDAANTISNDLPEAPDPKMSIRKEYGTDLDTGEAMAYFEEVNTDEVSAPSVGDVQYIANRHKHIVADDPESKRRRDIERNIQIENYWGDLFDRVQSESSGSGVRNTPVTSLYAGNFGSGTGISHDPAELAVSNMLIKEESNSIPGRVLLEAPGGHLSGEQGVTLRHMMPLNFGVSLTMPVSNSLSIVSGVNYSYLYSSSSQPLSGGEGSVKQELHYVGIPVGIMYSFYRNRVIDIYLRGGGTVEKAVYSRRTVDRNLGGEPEVAKMGVKGLQFSVDGAIGANFRVAPRVGLYLEPGVAYYFEGGNESTNFGTFSSYRTDNPVNFSLRIGVRFNI